MANTELHKAGKAGYILTMGEILVEIMATERGQSFRRPGTLIGPYASGAPAIFIDQVAHIGSRCAMIVDTGRYAADAFFRAAADSAKRAVLNPQCSPLHVPPDKYEAWHNLDLFFNPKDVL